MNKDILTVQEAEITSLASKIRSATKTSALYNWPYSFYQYLNTLQSNFSDLVAGECIFLSDETINRFGNYSKLISMIGKNPIDTLYLENCSMMGYQAFNTNTTIRQIILPNTTVIRPKAFNFCNNLEVCYCPNIKMVYNEAFCGCNSLYFASETFSQLSYIGNYGFAAVPLETVSLPAIQFIGGSAFRLCSDMYEIWIGTSNCSLGASTVFEQCINLESIYVPNSYVESYKASQYWSYYSSLIIGY